MASEPQTHAANKQSAGTGRANGGSRGAHLRPSGSSASSAAQRNAGGNSALPIASAVLGIVGIVCGLFFSWILCIVLGVVAIVLGIMAHRKRVDPLWAAKVGIVAGVLCIAVSVILVAIVCLQMIRLGLA